MIKKLTHLTVLIISIGLFSVYALFAQSNTTPLNQSSVLVDEYSNISKYVGNKGGDSIFLIGCQADLTPEMEMDPVIAEGVEEALGLEEFRKAVETHPTAERLVIHREGENLSLRPLKANPNTTKAAVHNENREIIDRLRSLLPPELADDSLLKYQLPSNANGVRIGVDPLSAARLSEILKKLDATNFTTNISSAIFAETNNKKVWNPLQSTAKGIGNILGVRKKGEALSQINTTGSIPTGSAEERSYIEKVIFKYSMIGRSTDEVTQLYQQADDFWRQAQQAWDDRTVVQLEVDNHIEKLQEVRKHREEEEEIRAAIDTKKTVLGKFSHWVGKGANVLASVPEPHAQVASTVAATVSSGADWINNRVMDAPVKTFKHEEKILNKKVDIADKIFKNVQLTAPELEENAQAAEERVRSDDLEMTIRVAKALIPPTPGSNETQWKGWTTRIVEASQLDISWIAKIAFNGMNDSLWAADQAQIAWKERIRLSEEYVKELESEESNDIKQFKTLRKDFEAARIAREKAKEELILSQLQLEKTSKDKADIEETLRKANEELNILERQNANLDFMSRAEINFKNSTSNYPINDKHQQQRIVIRAHANLRNADNTFKESKKILEHCNSIAVEAKKERLIRSKAYFDQGKIVLRKIDRAIACAIADRVAWNTVFYLTNGITIPESNWIETSKNETVKSLRKSFEEEFINEQLDSQKILLSDAMDEKNSREGKESITNNNLDHKIQNKDETNLIKEQSNKKIINADKVTTEEIVEEDKDTEKVRKGTETKNTAFETKGIEGQQKTIDFNRVVDSTTSNNVDLLKKVSETEQQEDQRIVILRTKAAEQWQLATEYKKKWINLPELLQQRNRWRKATEYAEASANRFECAVTSLEKANQAEKRGNQSLALIWFKSAEQNQMTAEYKKKCIRTYAPGNWQEYSRWNNASESSGASADLTTKSAASLEKATQAEKIENQSLALIWFKSTKQYQVAAEYYQKATEAYIQKNRVEGDRLGENSVSNMDQSIGYVASESADQLNKAAISLERVFEVKNNNNEAITILWEKSAEQNQIAAMYYQKSVEKHFFGDSNIRYDNFLQKTGHYAKQSANELKNAASSLESAIAAEHNNNQSLANLWREIAQKYQHIGDCYQKAATAYIQGNKEEYFSSATQEDEIEDKSFCFEEDEERFIRVFKFTLSTVNHLKQAAEEFEEADKKNFQYAEKAIEAKKNKNKSIYDLWVKMAGQYQYIVEYYKKRAEAKMRGNEEEIMNFDKSFWSIRGSAARLKSAAECIEESVQAETSKNQTVSNLWRKTAEQYQVAAEYERKDAEERIVKDEQEKKRWTKAASCAMQSADQLKKAAEALETSFIEGYQGNKLLSDLWRKIVVEHQTEAEYWRKAAETYETDNEQNISRFISPYSFSNDIKFSKSGAYQLRQAVISLQNAIKATTQGNQPLSDIWRKSSEQHQISAAHYLKAVEAEELGTCISLNKYSRLNEATTCALYSATKLENAATSFEKAIEAEKNGNQPLAILWEKSVEENQVVAEHYQKAYEEYVLGNEAEAEHWEKMAKSAKNVAIEANDIASRKAAKEEEKADKIDDYVFWSATALEQAAEALEKATEADKNGSHSLVSLWEESVKEHQTASEYYQKASKAYLLENEAEVKHWEEMASSAQKAAIAAECSTNDLKSAAEVLDVTSKATAQENPFLVSPLVFMQGVTQQKTSKTTTSKTLGKHLKKKLAVCHAKFKGDTKDQELQKNINFNNFTKEEVNITFTEEKKSSPDQQINSDQDLSASSAFEKVSKWKSLLQAESLLGPYSDNEKQYYCTMASQYQVLGEWLMEAETRKKDMESNDYAQAANSAEFNIAESYFAKLDLPEFHSAEFSTEQLTFTAKALKKSEESYNRHNTSLALLWSKIAQQHQEAIGYYLQEEESYVRGNVEEVTFFAQAADAARNRVASLEKEADMLAKQEKEEKMKLANDKSDSGSESDW